MRRGLLLSATFAAACSTTHAKPHWSYEGAEAPDKWAQLDPAFEACAKGKTQSPIDLPAREQAAAEAPALDYHASAARVIDNGHALEVGLAPGSKLSLDGTEYALVQFHLHAPSEHTVAGRAFPAELHLVHESADGKLAVVGLLVEEGSDNAPLAPIFAHLPAAGGAPVDAGAFDPAPLVPAEHKSFRYAGSLTTPPCTEGVRWTVLATPIVLSHEQLGRLRALHDHNARPPQPRNDRPVEG